MPDRLASLTGYGNFYRYHLPYLYMQIPHTGLKHVYIPLNRLYKPLGITDRDVMVDYAKFEGDLIGFPKDPRTYKGVWWGDGLFLYDDTIMSRVDYFERLDKLQGLGKLVAKDRVRAKEVSHAAALFYTTKSEAVRAAIQQAYWPVA